MPNEKQATPLRLRCFDCGGKDFVIVVEKDGFGHRYVRITCADCRRECRQVFVAGKERDRDGK
jgi:ribosomal protein S27E